MKKNIYGRKVGSGKEFVLLFSQGGATSSGNTSPEKLRLFEVENLCRAVKMLQERKVEGYVEVEDGSKKYTFTPDSDFVDQAMDLLL